MKTFVTGAALVLLSGLGPLTSVTAFSTPTRKQLGWRHHAMQHELLRGRGPSHPSPPRTSPSSSSSTALTSTLAFGIEKAVAVASLSATAKLLSSIGLGAWAAVTPNVLDQTAISALSRLTFWVFQPSFLLCSVSKTFYNASTGGGGLPGRFLALIPVVALLQIIMGNLVGKVITAFSGMEEEEGRDVRMCTTFANSGPLPLIFADALFGGSSIQAEVVACVSFYLLVWSPLFWSYGRVIVGTYGADDDGTPKSTGQKIVGEAKKILSPPVVGSILGVVVGTVPFFRNLFFKGIGKPLYGSLETLGTAYLPAALLILAGSLVGKKSKNQSQDDTVNGGDGSVSASPSIKAIVSIFFSRFVLAPLLSLGTLTVMQSLGLLGPAGTRARAVVSFLLLCEGCMPPAQNSVIMLQLEGLQERATSMAKLLTLMYSLAVIPVTLLLSACLSASGIMAFR